MAPKKGKRKLNSTDSECFNEGSLVEVSSDKDGYMGVWYSAKVIAPQNKRKIRGTLLIEYQTLVSEDESPLIEHVDSVFVRPLPPAVVDSNNNNNDQPFEVNDIVDAFHLDGWWVGVVVNVIQEDESKRYSVFFENPPDLIEFSRSDLRLHLDWVSGDWVRPQKQEASRNLDYQKKLRGACMSANSPNVPFLLESPSALNGNEEAVNSTPCNEVVTSRGNGLEQTTPESGVTISRPFKKQKEGGNSSQRKRERSAISLRRGAKAWLASLERTGGADEKVIAEECAAAFEVELPTITELPIITEGESAEFSPDRTLNQSNEARGDLMEIAKQIVAKEATSDVVPEATQCFPFVKSSSIWRTIESMEVFQKMPQNPHFCPLNKRNRAYHEGLAIGHMITFANLVEETSKLQFNDPRGVLNCFLEVLDDLEKHGFSVKAVRSRINDLQSIKDKKEQLQEESKVIERQIMERTCEKNKIEQEFDSVVQEIMELQEKRDKIMSMKGKNDSEIASLRSSVDVIYADMERVQLDFESLVGSPW